jgi:sulfate adenylyltransferase
VHAVSPPELADLELLLSGALAPLDRFLTPAEAEAARATGRLPRGVRAPLAPLLTVPKQVADRAVATGSLILSDPEGLPLARLEVTERVSLEAGDVLAGRVTPLATPAHGGFRSLRRPPAAVRAQLPVGRVPAVPVDRPLLADDVAMLDELRNGASHVLLLVRDADAVAGVPAETLVRATLAAVGGLDRISPLTVPLRHSADPAADERTVAAVAAAYGATEIHPLGPAAAWHQALAALDRGAGPRSPGLLPVPGPVLAELLRWRPPRAERGVTVFFTGLPAAGKSTVARALIDALAERSARRCTLLDGDVVRRMLSTGLGFSRADRDLNIRRIGWVAAEVSRHGGLVVCAPIAPYAAVRAEVRAMVQATGADFVLVYLATPLSVCEERDPKGLYRAAREGRIRNLTGVSDPYEAPDDAELVLDASRGSPADLAQRVLDLLVGGGWVTGR